MAKVKTDALTDALSGIGDAWKKSMKGETILHSNKVINHIGGNYVGGAEMVSRMLGKDGVGLKEAAVRTFAQTAENADAYLKEGSKEALKLNVGKIAGSYIGVSAAARVVGGGGLTRDNNGNSNLIGVPFV